MGGRANALQGSLHTFSDRAEEPAFETDWVCSVFRIPTFSDRAEEPAFLNSRDIHCSEFLFAGHLRSYIL